MFLSASSACPGIVVDLHDRVPQSPRRKTVKIKNVIEALDLTPVLDEQLLKLGRWIADYYLAPIGEVLRTMLPLSAEFKRAVVYSITDTGHMALHLAGMSGSPARSQRTPEQQLVEFRVLDYLAARDGGRANENKSAQRDASFPRASCWHGSQEVDCARRCLGGARCRTDGEGRRVGGSVGRRTPTDKSGVARGSARKRSADVPRGSRGGTPGRDPSKAQCQSAHADRHARRRRWPRPGRNSALSRSSSHHPRHAGSPRIGRTCRGAARIHGSKLKPRRSPFEFEFSSAQQVALAKILEGVNARKFSGMLLHGVTGSGKTAVYLAVMREVLEQGRSSILLVPEIGLTPAMAADLIQVFGDEVAILHSGLSDDERAEQWHRIKRGEARVVVGTRSAVFAPVSDLALVIVDEEQDSSYKQEETPRYQCARRGRDARENGGRGRRSGLGHALARVVLQRQEEQIRADRAARPRGEPPAARSRNSRHAAGISGNGQGARSFRASWRKKSASGWRKKNR